MQKFTFAFCFLQIYPVERKHSIFLQTKKIFVAQKICIGELRFEINLPNGNEKNQMQKNFKSIWFFNKKFISTA